ncbi:MAG TPA: hypothetical protein VJZ93_01095 [Candidatus Nanoarchaeia archaeon]|nr:hypothetical protein [Candidatus Nanoarchaeia archaeon]
MKNLVGKTAFIKVIREKISKTKNQKEREKLKELEKAVKNNQKSKIKKIIDELPEDIGKWMDFNVVGGILNAV